MPSRIWVLRPLPGAQRHRLEGGADPSLPTTSTPVRPPLGDHSHSGNEGFGGEGARSGNRCRGSCDAIVVGIHQLQFHFPKKVTLLVPRPRRDLTHAVPRNGDQGRHPPAHWAPDQEQPCDINFPGTLATASSPWASSTPRNSRRRHWPRRRLVGVTKAPGNQRRR